MVLQSVNNNRTRLEASSLYCVWVRNECQPGAPLVCIWIDSTNEGMLRAIGCDDVTEEPARTSVADAEDNSDAAVESPANGNFPFSG